MKKSGYIGIERFQKRKIIAFMPCIRFEICFMNLIYFGTYQEVCKEYIGSFIQKGNVEKLSQVMRHYNLLHTLLGIKSSLFRKFPNVFEKNIERFD